MASVQMAGPETAFNDAMKSAGGDVMLQKLPALHSSGAIPARRGMRFARPWMKTGRELNRFLRQMSAAYKAEGRAADGRGLIEFAGEERGRRVPGCRLTEKGEALYRHIGDVREA